MLVGIPKEIPRGIMGNIPIEISWKFVTVTQQKPDKRLKEMTGKKVSWKMIVKEEI